jgi:tellurite resistance protein
LKKGRNGDSQSSNGRSPSPQGKATILAFAEFQSDAQTSHQFGVARSSINSWRQKLGQDPELYRLWIEEIKKLKKQRSQALVKKAEELADAHQNSYKKARQAAEGCIDSFIELQKEAKERGENPVKAIPTRDWKKFDIAVQSLHTAIQGERQSQGLHHLLNAQWASSALEAMGYEILDPYEQEELKPAKPPEEGEDGDIDTEATTNEEEDA